MADVLPFRSPNQQGPSQPDAVGPSTLNEFDAECLARFTRNCSSRGMSPSYASKVVKTFTRFLREVDKPLVDIQESDYEAWSANLSKIKGRKHSTRRTYQRDVRRVIGYLCEAMDLQNEAQRKFGKRMVLFAHSQNSILHKVEDECGSDRRAMSHEDFQALMDSLDARIERAAQEKPREYPALARDKVLIYVTYLYGLRVSEVSQVAFHDWSCDPSNPECGRYALLRVRFGKAARGSGKRHRVVPSTDPLIVDLIDWYREAVWPLFKVSDESKQFVFLSERGRRISTQSIQARLKEHLEAAGLSDRGITPHCLRHSTVTHEVMRSGLEFARSIAGHKSSHTTQIYTHIPADHVRARVRRLVDAQVAQTKKPSLD